MPGMGALAHQLPGLGSSAEHAPHAAARQAPLPAHYLDRGQYALSLFLLPM
jgi:hypothetical protein